MSVCQRILSINGEICGESVDREEGRSLVCSRCIKTKSGRKIVDNFPYTLTDLKFVCDSYQDGIVSNCTFLSVKINHTYENVLIIPRIEDSELISYLSNWCELPHRSTYSAVDLVMKKLIKYQAKHKYDNHKIFVTYCDEDDNNEIYTGAHDDERQVLNKRKINGLEFRVGIAPPIDNSYLYDHIQETLKEDITLFDLPISKIAERIRNIIQNF